MKLFLLVRGTVVGYDQYDSFVVRAENEAEARKIAASKYGDEGPAEWLENWRSRCDELTPDGDAGVIIGSFNAG